LPHRIVAVIAASFALLVAADLAAADGGSARSGGATITQSGEIYVKRGYRGPGVRLIQRRLGLTADGVFGPLTERAVKRFQRRHGLVSDGVVGPITRRALGIGRFSRGSVYRRAGSRSGLPRVLRRIAECESGGDPTAVSPHGRYRGKYQFTRATWRRLGGEGDPADAPEWLQDRLALKLYRQSGTASWPGCAR
jgi:Transglycosylase-like domain/Putative peptidoglycan binding domain